jgi:hypothetical protein
MNLGVLNNEYTGLYEGTGFTSRTPGGYLRYDHTTGAPFVPAEPLEDTNEKIHASIRIRCGLQGHLPRTGTAPDAGIYTGSALTGKPGAKGWQIHGLPTPPPQTGKMSLNQIHEYQQKISWVKAGNTTVMEEDLIGEVEWALLNKLSPDIANNFFGYAPKPT